MSEFVAKSISQRRPIFPGVFVREGSACPALQLIGPCRAHRVGVGYGGLVQAREELSGDLGSIPRGQGERLAKDSLGLDRHRRQGTAVGFVGQRRSQAERRASDGEAAR